MRSRALLAALAVLLAIGAGEAQPARRVWRIGYLGDGFRAERLSINLTPFRDGLRELGYVEGHNLAIEERWTDGRAERVAEHAADLVRLKVDVILTHSVRSIKAAQNATTTIPIVGAVMPDPIGNGLVSTLARPGGNTTGMTDQVTELADKEIQILKDALPNAKRTRWSSSTTS